MEVRGFGLLVMYAIGRKGKMVGVYSNMVKGSLLGVDSLGERG